MVNEAEILNQLNLGASKAVLENRPNSLLGKLLEGLAQEVVDKLKESIDKKGISTPSAGLRQSINITEATLGEDGVTVGVSASFYWKFVNYGVNGYEINHGAPNWGVEPSRGITFKESIDSWIVNNGIIKPENFSNYDSFSFAIMQGIKRDGKAPRPFFTDVVNAATMKKLRNPIERLLKESIRIRILEPWQ